jgi:uncharacterized membrane protein YbhN (UPF0104 family)
MSVESRHQPPGTLAVTWWSWGASRSGLIRAASIIAVTAAVVIGLANWVGTTDVVNLIRALSPRHLLLATALTLTLPFSHAVRLQAALAASDYRLGFWRAFRLTMAVWPISSFTPAKSGDLLKAYYLRDEIPVAVTAGALLAERAIDLAVWGVLSFVASVFVEQAVVTAFSAAVLGGVLFFVCVLAPRADRLPISTRWRERLGLLFSSTRGVARRPRLLIALVCLTLVNCLATIAVTSILYDGVGAAVPWYVVTAALLPAMFAGLLPLTVAGMGTRDSALIMLFEGYATGAQSLSVGLLYAFFFRWLLSLLGLPLLRQALGERLSASDAP